MQSYVNGQKVTNEPGASPVIEKAEGSAGDAPQEIVDTLTASPFHDFFKADRWDRESNEKISYLVKHLKQEGEEDIDVINRIRRIDSTIGTERLGQTKLTKIYGYVKMANAIQGQLLGNL